jgi:hypothetical protein
MAVIALRPVEDADLDALFDQGRDPKAVWMAAFTVRTQMTDTPSTLIWPG